jgi:hypothetical protein
MTWLNSHLGYNDDQTPEDDIITAEYLKTVEQPNYRNFRYDNQIPKDGMTTKHTKLNGNMYICLRQSTLSNIRSV